MRLLRPGLVVFALAVLASLAVHLPIYSALGVLAEALLNAPEAAKQTLVELELAPLGDEDDPKEEEAVAEAEPKDVVPPRPEPQPQAPPPPTPAVAKPEPVAKPTLELLKPQPKPPPRPTPPPESQNKLAVTQKSEDPDVEPPPDARFAAEDNRRVEEETVAAVRNLQRDDAEPELGKPNKSELPDLGNDDEQESADLREQEGSDERAPTPEGRAGAGGQPVRVRWAA